MSVYDRGNLLLLKAKVKSLSHNRREIRNQIKKIGKANSKLNRAMDESQDKAEIQKWMNQNNMVISHIRYAYSGSARIHHLAYGLLRGVPYRKMERNTEHTDKSREVLAKKVLEVIHEYSSYFSRREWTLEKVINLLE